MHSIRRALTAAGICVTAAATVFASTPVASAAPPTQDCTGWYSARITQWAMLCGKAGEPIAGAFATWRNLPITFDGSYDPTINVAAANYLTVTPDTTAFSNVRIGLYAQKTGPNTATYAPHWEELTGQGGRETAVNTGSGPGTADGKNHSYLLQRQPNGDQWEVFYDFNSVGTTTGQKPVPRGDQNRIDVGLEVNHPEHVNVPLFDDRPQYLSENKVWSRLLPDRTASQLGLGTCGEKDPFTNTVNTPPYCFDATQTLETPKPATPPGIASWRVGKPLVATTPAPPAHSSAFSAPGADDRPAIYHGVDQQLLHACLQNSPGSCLSQVPGLAECLRTFKQCNEADVAPRRDRSLASRNRETTGAVVDGLLTRTAREFGVPRESLKVAAATVADDHSGRTQASGWPADTALWTITSQATTRGRTGTGPAVMGLSVSYTQSTGELTAACWGAACGH